MLLPLGGFAASDSARLRLAGATAKPSLCSSLTHSLFVHFVHSSFVRSLLETFAHSSSVHFVHTLVVRSLFSCSRSLHCTTDLVFAVQQLPLGEASPRLGYSPRGFAPRRGDGSAVAMLLGRSLRSLPRRTFTPHSLRSFVVHYSPFTLIHSVHSSSLRGCSLLVHSLRSLRSLRSFTRRSLRRWGVGAL